jgi:hypothetical protein
MNGKKTSLLALVAACSLVLLVSEAWPWLTSINGTADTNDGAFAVAVDLNGDVVAAGITQNTGTGPDFTVAKFSGVDGTEQWRQVIDGTANGADGALAVAVDSSGDVLAAGFTTNTGTSADFTVIKLSGANGTVLWDQRIDGTAVNAFDRALAVAVNASGDVVAAGFTDNINTGLDFTVIKFSGADGTVLWDQRINGTANGLDAARAVVVDAAGNVVAGGTTFNTGTSVDFTVVKLSGADGTVLWQSDINGTADDPDEALAVTLDVTGDVVAAGSTRNIGTGRGFTVVKLSGVDGVEQWRQVINGAANVSEARAVAVDAVGDVVASGTIFNTGTSADLAVVKFDGVSGVEKWRQVIDGSGSANGASSVAVDVTGDVVASGLSQITSTGSNFTVIKFAGVDGIEQWRRAIKGSANRFDGALAVKVDALGDVVTGGFTENTGTLADLTVVKLSGTDGSDF